MTEWEEIKLAHCALCEGAHLTKNCGAGKSYYAVKIAEMLKSKL